MKPHPSLLLQIPDHTKQIPCLRIALSRDIGRLLDAVPEIGLMVTHHKSGHTLYGSAKTNTASRG